MKRFSLIVLTAALTFSGCATTAWEQEDAVIEEWERQSAMKYKKLGARSIDWLPSQAATAAPGWDADSVTNIKDSSRNGVMVAGLPDSVMVTLYEQIPAPLCPYIPGVFDCENISRWYAAHAAELWGRLIKRGVLKEPMLLDHGVVMGVIPIGNLPAGGHAANFFFNDEGRYRMWEPQQRRLLTPEEVARSKKIRELEYHS